MGRAMVLLAALVLAGLAPAAAAQEGGTTPFRAVAKVNGDAITGWDVEQRARLLGVIGQAGGSQSARARAALDRLVEERLMLQAGEARGIEPDPEMVAEGIAELAGRSGLAPETFRAGLAEAGVEGSALEDMVGAQMVWREVVRQRFADRVEPTDAEIDSEIALAGEGRARVVELREIGLALEGEGRSPAETRALAAAIVAELRAGGDFAAAVARHSTAPSAGNGGRVGEVALEALPDEIARALAPLEPGGLTDPLRVGGGYSILQVVSRRSAAGPVPDPQDAELRAQMRRGLVSERLERLSQGLLQDLRRDALIQVR